MNNACPNCRTVYNITPQHIGRTTGCKQCGAVLIVEPQGLSLAQQPKPAPASTIDSRDPYDEAPRTRPTRSHSVVFDYLVFRRMFMPILIQMLFWLGVLGCLIAGFIWFIIAVTARDGNIWFLLLAFLSVFLGPIVARLYCELLILPFRINETLTEIKNEVGRTAD